MTERLAKQVKEYDIYTARSLNKVTKDLREFFVVQKLYTKINGPYILMGLLLYLHGDSSSFV